MPTTTPAPTTSPAAPATVSLTPTPALLVGSLASATGLLPATGGTGTMHAGETGPTVSDSLTSASGVSSASTPGPSLAPLGLNGLNPGGETGLTGGLSAAGALPLPPVLSLPAVSAAVSTAESDHLAPTSISPAVAMPGPVPEPGPLCLPAIVLLAHMLRRAAGRVRRYWPHD